MLQMSEELICGHVIVTMKMCGLASVIGLAAFYAWARAKHFGCHSVCLSFCHHGEVTFRSSSVNIACSTATSLSPLIEKVSFYCTFVSRDPHKV